MASVTLPRLPGYAAFEAFLVDAGGTIRSPLSQAAQRVNRLGSRFGLSVQYPPFRQDDAARKLVALLNEGLSEGVKTHWPQVDFDPGAPGLVKVNGGSQAGSSLIVDGVGQGYSFRHGQFGHVAVGGRLHLFQLRGDVLYSNGNATLPILPMLRGSPADNEAVEFAQPMIEGWLEGETASWTVDRARTTGLQFTVIEG